MTVLYLIGSLRNPELPNIALRIRELGFEVYDDWYSVGPEADDRWKDYEEARQRSYLSALEGYHARQTFEMDRYHLNRAHGGVLILPAGKSGHLELGYLTGQKKPGFVLIPPDQTPDRYDIMTCFGEVICNSLGSLLSEIQTYSWPPTADIQNISPLDAMWLVGLLEGDGTFVCDSMNGRARPRPRIALQMTDEDTVRRVAALLGSNVWGPRDKVKGRKPVWACAVTGQKAAEWMRILLPYFSSRRQERICRILATWNPYTYRRHRQKKEAVGQ